MIPDNNPLNDGNNILVVDKHLAKLIGLNESIVLRQLDNWLRSRFSKEMEDKHWVYNTYKQWQDDKNFPFWSISTIRRIFDNLEKNELVITTSKFNKVKYDKTKWYTINYDKVLEMIPTEKASVHSEKATAQNEQTDVSKMNRPTAQNEQFDVSKMSKPIPNKTQKITTNKTTKTTTTPTATPLSSSLLSTSQSGESLSDSNEQAIATAILDLFSADRARQLIHEHGYEKIYRACCYVAHANRDKPKDKHLSPRFVFGELNGAGNIPANYQPPEDYSRDQEWEDWKNERDNSGPEPVQELDPVPESQTVVEAKPDPAPKQQPIVVEQSPEEGNWSAVLQQVKLQQESVFDAYLQNTKLRAVQHNTYVVEVRDEVARDVLQGRFYSLIKMLMSGLTNPNVAVRFCIPGEVVTIEPPQPDPEPEKPVKVEPITPAKKPMPKTFRVVEPDEQPVTPEQLMAGRMLFQQMVSKLKADPIAEPDNITDIVAPAEDAIASEVADEPVEIDTPTG